MTKKRTKVAGNSPISGGMRAYLIVSSHVESLMANLGQVHSESKDQVAQFLVRAAMARTLHDLYEECVGARYPARNETGSPETLLADTGWPTGLVYYEHEALWGAPQPAQRFSDILREALEVRGLTLPELTF